MTKTGNAAFHVASSYGWSASGASSRFKLVSYPSGRVSFPVESTTTWATKEEAEAVCAKVNAGDESGVSFASYSDD
jgi:hypothetical protein